MMDFCTRISWARFLAEFLEHADSLVVIQADAKGRIVECNLALMRFLRKDERPLGRLLGEIFRSTDGSIPDFCAFSPDNPPLPQILKLRSCDDVFKVTCSVHDSQMLVLAEHIGCSNNVVMQIMSSLTNELVNIGRELSRKNRELGEAKSRIEAISRTDSLTGLANRRFFMERLQESISLADRHEQELCLLMADLDHFKRINDTHGHDTGDRVLQSFAAILSRSCRKEDLAARAGGEEFFLLLPMTSEEDALRMAVRMCASMRVLDVLEQGAPVTVSVGVACHHRGDSPDQVLGRVDQALLRAKEQGRDRVSL
jgi:diguanylate cyclase (GGDEF)-like protein